MSHVKFPLPHSVTVAGKAIPVTVSLGALNQSLTYEGLLEGLPTEKLNHRLIQGALAKARSTFGPSEPYLIEPEQKPITYDGNYPFSTPASLPEILCIARFHSVFPARDSSLDYSSLTVVWFQDEFALPIADSVVEGIKQIDWRRLATDYEY